MNVNKLLRLILVTAVFVAFLAWTKGANAVSISPLTFELVANPGETVSNVVKVTNSEPTTVNVVIDLEDFTAVGEEGQVTLEAPDENLSYSLASWVSVSPDYLVLQPGETGTVEFTVSLPPNAEPGGHYASILASITSGGGQQGGSSVVQKVGALVLMNVAGDVRENLYVKEFSVARYSEYGPVSIVSRFENDGTVHLKPRGFILIKNIFGKEVAQLDVPQKNVLPHSIRRIEVPWGEKLMFGRYEATLTAIYGSANQPLSSVTSFWVIPWKITVAILIGLIALLSFFIKGRKRIRLALSVLFRGTHRLQELK